MADPAGRPPPRAHAPGQQQPRIPAGPDSPESKLAALREQLLDEAAAVRTAEDWERTLQAAARLPGESFANILLIEAQRPGTTLVKGYEEWRVAGRQVSKGEPGIEVFSASPRHQAGPSPDIRRKQEPEPAPPGWRDARRVAYLWDISQTSGPPVTAQAALPGAPSEVPAGLWDALCWLARREGFAVEHEHGAPADGVTFWTPRRIRVLPGQDSGPAAWALAHQLGHVLMHGDIPRQPGGTTSGDACTATPKAEADALAYITLTRYGITIPNALASPATWAGTDPRAQPAASIVAAGQRITTAVTRVTRHLDTTLPGTAPTAVAVQQSATTPAPRRPPRKWSPDAAGTRQPARPATEHAVADARLIEILGAAGAFYSGRLAGSWVPAYLHSRGFGADVAREWQVGYAPAEWSALTDHLRASGCADQEIEAAGLARRTSRGTLIDFFRNRVMLPVHDQHGQIAGFTGRARPGAGPAVPKYLNSPETAVYKKGDLLFGLHEARRSLTAGATPVIVEGPFDAIAVTTAGTGHLAGLAPCGTALTTRQAELLTANCDLAGTAVLVAFDDDPAGRKAAIRAYPILRPHTASLRSAQLSGRDPAQILQEEGPQALRDALTTRAEPLLSVVLDADVSRWEHRLGDVEGPVRAMRSAAAICANLLPPSAAEQVRKAAGGTLLATVDEEMQPVGPPQASAVAKALPTDTAIQVMRLADRLGLPAIDVVIEIANAVTRHAALQANRQPVASLATSSFPVAPMGQPPGTGASPKPPRPFPAGLRQAHGRHT